ncbi:MAG: SAM-dependent chlorinase/fluorinase [Caldilineales bacterium]|nr:SAM-dependent chlorinase/fluorinase [Caldilineales bacterium]
MSFPPIRFPENVPSLITLTTDFGLADPYVAAMKGVILDILPWAKIVDISHAIAAQNVMQAAYVLATAAPYFPRRTVHIVVVDPGVGTQRRPIAVYTDTACYIGPDNGVFSLVYAKENVAEVRLLQNVFYMRPAISNTFHGRDVFAPFAAYVAAGAPGNSLGPLVHDPVALPIPKPTRESDGSIVGQVIYIDHFGNLVSDIPGDWLNDGDWTIEIAGAQIHGTSATYGNVDQGELVALIGSSGLLEVAVRNGSAAQKLGIGPSATVVARPLPS